MIYNYFMENTFTGKKPETVLKTVFGYESFRPMQRDIIQNVLSGNDTLAIMPTGGGKSLCYQIPALIFDGITVVVSPLISLMQDQVSQLKSAGIDAVFLNSSLEWSDYTESMRQIRQGEIKIVYISPEGLSTSKIRDLLSSVKVSCITIDEAHCISQWGHDFRPDYLEIYAVRRLFPDAVFLALTATATKQVREDIIRNLALKNPAVLVSSFDRPNIYLEVKPKRDSVSQVVDCIRKHWGESGIIYCFSKKSVDELTQTLIDLGYSALNYHAGLSQEERCENQEKFLRDEIQIMVATLAFGMGINKPNVRYVIHYDLPKSVEQYYQEIGRAGRDGLPSTALLLYTPGDIRKIKFLLKDNPDEENYLRLLQGMIDFAQARRCRRKVILSYFGEIYDGENKCCCDICDYDTGVKDRNDDGKKDVTIVTQKLLSAIIKTGMRFGSIYVINVLLGVREKRLIENGHNMISTWNIGHELSKEDWLELIAALIESGYIEKTEDYNVLKITDLGRSSLRNRDEIRLAVRFKGDLSCGNGIAGTGSTGKTQITTFPKPQGILRKKSSKSLRADFSSDEISQDKKIEAKRSFEDSLSQEQRLLCEKIKKWRRKTASEMKVPPYIIFGDKTLYEIVEHRPETKDDLYNISGLGERKIEKYGEDILNLI